MNAQSAGGQMGNGYPVDVIVPVYRGLEETRQCIESVLGATTGISYELVIINDRSPEPELVAYLAGLAERGRISLLHNERNLGFVATVNRGMQQHPQRDVLLLNSDTQVADGWLDRLAAAMGSAADIGTVTPFSNNATIYSYPFADCDPAWLKPTDVALVDGCFAVAQAGRVVDIPTAVGFCMGIRRACLDDVGYFDSDTFGLGYGEECDFSRKALKKGWRNILAADVFVYHAGGVSFGAEREARMRRAESIMEERHPDYGPAVDDFVCRDPLRPVRLAVDSCLIDRQPADCRRWHEMRASETERLLEKGVQLRQWLSEARAQYRVVDAALGEAQKTAQNHLQALHQLHDETQEGIARLEALVHKLTQENHELHERWDWIANTRLGRLALWLKEKISGH